MTLNRSSKERRRVVVIMLHPTEKLPSQDFTRYPRFIATLNARTPYSNCVTNSDVKSLCGHNVSILDGRELVQMA
jgi:hypothetical protein